LLLNQLQLGARKLLNSVEVKCFDSLKIVYSLPSV